IKTGNPGADDDRIEIGGHSSGWFERCFHHVVHTHPSSPTGLPSWMCEAIGRPTPGRRRELPGPGQDSLGRRWLASRRPIAIGALDAEFQLVDSSTLQYQGRHTGPSEREETAR